MRLKRLLFVGFACSLAGIGLAGTTFAAPAQATSFTVGVANNATHGQILVNSQGMTLYTLSTEANTNFVCATESGCESLWPPLFNNNPTKDPAVTGTVASFGDPNYHNQVTVNGFPVYTYAGDSKPGDTNGEGVSDPSGGTWHIALNSTSSTGSPTPTPTPTSTTPPASGPLVQVATDAKLGRILVNSQNRTLYFNTAETSTTFVCKGGCLNNWPPLLLPAGMSSPTFSSDVVGKLDVVSRSDAGGQQVTFNGQPLYAFVGDKAAGDTKGEGIAALGGVWHAAVVPNAPATKKLTIRITATGKTVWGKVTVSYTSSGSTAQKSCKAARCQFNLPVGATMHLSEKPKNKSTWPFSQWKISQGKTKIVHGTKAKVKLSANTTITAVYRLAGR